MLCYTIGPSFQMHSVLLTGGWGVHGSVVTLGAIHTGFHDPPQLLLQFGTLPTSESHVGCESVLAISGHVDRDLEF
eukprot:2873546-Amphidinium_carterae.1